MLHAEDATARRRSETPTRPGGRESKYPAPVVMRTVKYTPQVRKNVIVVGEMAGFMVTVTFSIGSKIPVLSVGAGVVGSLRE